MKLRQFAALASFCAVALTPNARAAAQEPAGQPAMERLGQNLFRVGSIRIDTSARTLQVPGLSNAVSILEFVANTKGGLKSYESAVELDTDAITFNLALMLIGLDPDHAVKPEHHFDPNTPEGDPVAIWVEWSDTSGPRRVRGGGVAVQRKDRPNLSGGTVGVYRIGSFCRTVGFWRSWMAC